MTNSAENFAAFPLQRNLPEIRRAASASNWEIAHYHEELEFNLVLAGKGAYFFEDRHYELTPGTLVWILPGQRHRLLRSPDLDMWVGALGPAHHTPGLIEEVALHPIKRLAAEDAVALDQLFSHVSQDADSPDIYDVGLKYAALTAMHMARTSEGPPPPVLHPGVTQALAILRADDEIANLAALAKRCGLSSSYLGDLLQAQTGRGFVEWRNIARLERFQDFFPQSEDLLTAALAAGFGSYTQFHRVFQDMVGSTPGNWARKRSDGGPIRLPRMSQVKDQLSPGSQRLLWYNLGSVGFSASDAWLQALVKGGVTPPEGEGGEAIASGADDLAQLEPFLQKLTEEMAQSLPEHGPRIREVLGTTDVLGQYSVALGLMGADFRDLTSLAAISLGAQTLVAGWAKLPSREDLGRLRAFVRYRAAQPSAATDPAQRLEIATGLVMQSMVLRNAWSGAGGSRSEVVATRLSDTVHASTLKKLGVDLRLTPFYGSLSPLSVSDSES